MTKIGHPVGLQSFARTLQNIQGRNSWIYSINFYKVSTKYTVNIEKEDLINIYVRQWVLLWCKKYHPEAFEEAEKFVIKLIDESEKQCNILCENIQAAFKRK